MMTMTPAAHEYFNHHADQWDDLQTGYYSVNLRAVAIQKAYLRPEYIVADIGAGTGFISAGLAPLVQHVFALDGSDAMLEAAQRNLSTFTNVTYHRAESLELPLPSESLDAVFANMYLHHCTDPVGAIREMSRLLRPGGRLVITDMDAHSYSWLQNEMADAWQGFERDQIRTWFKQAELVNVIVDSTGENCSAESEQPQEDGAQKQRVSISTFVAVGTRRLSGVREAVQAGYGAVAQGKSGCCSSSIGDNDSSCCGNSTAEIIPLEMVQEPQSRLGYAPETLQTAPKEAVEISLGCGNPLSMASLREGEVVLDIGSGGGMDAFIAARLVGLSGRVIGVDLTPAMLERARRTAEKGGYSQVEFRQGQAEALPVADGQVDVVISNCVINLCEDKGQVFQEAYRVLKTGGRLEVSDVVTSRSFPRELTSNPSEWAGCVFGALPEQEYLDLIAQAGFTDLRIQRSVAEAAIPGVQVYSALVSARKTH